MNAVVEKKDSSPSLPAPVARRGIDEATWRTLCNSVFPGALSDSILMAVDYCRARGLDVLKRPCHIVPMAVTEKRRKEDGGVEERKVWRDVILPGIYEYRTTAQRTGEYLGHSKPEYGPNIDFKGVTAPEWCSMTFYRWNHKLGERAEYPVTVYFSEVVVTNNNGAPNARWTKAPRQMLTKCTEAAGLREAFPDEIGGEPTAEEMEGRTIDVTPEPVSTKPQAQPPQAKAGAKAHANDEQLAEIRRALDETGIPERELLAHFKVAELEELSFDDAQHALEWISANAP